VLVGYCALLLNRSLATAARPETAGPVRFGLDSAVGALAVWIGCFLAGPVVPAALACLYWMQCGDPAVLDWMIIAELVVPAVAWWLAALTVVNATGAAATPGRVIDVLWRLGWRSWRAACLNVILAAGGIAGLAFAARLIHQESPAGYLLLMLSSAGGVFAQGLILRRLGLAWSAAGASRGRVEHSTAARLEAGAAR
jgi:hypothetical protein